MESLIEYKVNTSNGELMFVKNSHDERIYKLGFTEQMFEDKVELVMNGYELKKEDGKLYAVKKKHVYPKTCTECSSVINGKCADDIGGYKGIRLYELQCLLICRDAYWKIAGEQMGLGKPWKPDWMDGKIKYGISPYQNTIIKDMAIRANGILVFPTPEMRDAFYENFKELINSCKKLL